MPETLQHCVIAMDENGNFIQCMDLQRDLWAPYRKRKVWTTDWDEALRCSGFFNSTFPAGITLHPNNRRNLPSVKVGGYEIVSTKRETTG